MQAIQKYKNYRTFLAHSFDHAKREQNRLSASSYAKKLGLSASNFKMIVSGKRNLTSEHCLRVARAFRMSEQETSFFWDLVQANQAKSQFEKSFFSKRMAGHKKISLLQNVHTSSKTLLQDAVAPSLVVYLSDYLKKDKTLAQLDVKKVSENLKVSVADVQRLIELLTAEGLLENSAAGSTHFVFDKLINLFAQKAYLKRVLNEAGKKMDTDYDQAESFFSVFTFSTSDKDLVILREELKMLMEKHMSKVDATDPKARFARACFQVYPL